MEIVLRSYVPTSTLVVKSEGFDKDSQVTGGLDLSMWRWDQGNSSTDVSTYELLNAELGGEPDPSDGWKRDIHLQPAQYFKDRTSEVGFMGYYPNSSHAGWQKAGGKLLTKDAEGRPMMTYNIDGATDVLFSDFKKGSFNSGVGHLTFSHALCRYRVYVYAVDDDAKEQWGDITDVTFLNLPQQLYVHLPKNFTDASQKTEFSFSPAPANQSDYIPTKIVGDQTISPPVGSSSKQLIGTYLGGAPAIDVLGISLETENFNSENKVSPVSIARDFQPGHTYNIMLRLSTHGVINVDVVTEEWVDAGEHDVTVASQYFMDLSRYGTSNSYIVSSSNMAYCFDATVKGNGVNRMVRYDGEVFELPDKDISLQTLGVQILSSDSKLIWDESLNDYRTLVDANERHGEMIKLLADQVINGKILFEVPGLKGENGFPIEGEHRLLRKGNARIGGFDAAGNLIWSWHIWVTDRPRNLNYGNGYVSMDRNLGAVSTDPADFNTEVPVLSGCVYQWGRKDPFFFHEIKNHPEYIKVAPVSIAEAHKYPRSFFARTEEAYEAGGYDWTTETNDHLWGWISERDNVVKTLYDPCPPGYRVNGNALWEFQNPEQDAPVEVHYDGSSNEFKGTNIGYYFGITNYAQIYYPATMFLHHDGSIVKNHDPHQEDNGKAYVYRYSATPYVSDDPDKQGLSYHFRYNIEDSKAGKGILVWEPETGGGRVQAFPVRCVYEDSRHEITNLSSEQTANSYIVDQARYFKFNAVTPGNAVGALNVQFNDGSIRNVTFDGGVDKTLPVEKVDVLWWQGDLTSGSSFMTEAAKNNLTQQQMQDLCPIVLLDDGRVDEDGYATFRVPQDKLQNANIILAGYDVSGVIQWTWHIWMLPDGVEVVRFGNYSLLDRNLGATYAPESTSKINQNNALSTHGFFYQWGRKDPFVGRATIDQGNNQITSSPWFYKPYNGQWQKMTSLQKLGRSARNIIETIKNPTLFASSGGSPWQNLYECTNENDGPINHMWGYTGVKGAWGDTFAKTMWDPCPPGYKVLNHETLQAGGLWDANNNGDYRLYYRTNNGGAPRSDYGLWLYGDGSASTGGMYTTANANSTTSAREVRCDGLWFPNTWRINESGNYAQYQGGNNYRPTYYSKSGYLHTACPFSGAHTRTYKWYQNANDYANTGHDIGINMSVGTAIRCLKE